MDLFTAATLAMLLKRDCRTADLSIGRASLKLEVANTASERHRGLQDRLDLAPLDGMLFVYEQPGPVRFWTADTPLPLDMIFLGGNAVVRKIHASAIPFDKTPIDGGETIQLVIELAAGRAAALDIEPGDRIEAVSCSGDVPGVDFF